MRAVGKGDVTAAFSGLPPQLYNINIPLHQLYFRTDLAKLPQTSLFTELFTILLPGRSIRFIQGRGFDTARNDSVYGLIAAGKADTSHPIGNFDLKTVKSVGHFHGPLLFSDYSFVYRQDIFPAHFSIDYSQFRHPKIISFVLWSSVFFISRRILYGKVDWRSKCFYDLSALILAEVMSAFVTLVFIAEPRRERVDSAEALLAHLELGRVSLVCPTRMVCAMLTRPSGFMPEERAEKFSKALAADPFSKLHASRSEALDLLASRKHNYVLLTGISYRMDARSRICGLVSHTARSFPPNWKGIYTHEADFLSVGPQHVAMAQEILRKIVRLFRNVDCQRSAPAEESRSIEGFSAIFALLTILTGLALALLCAENASVHCNRGLDA